MFFEHISSDFFVKFSDLCPKTVSYLHFAVGLSKFGGKVSEMWFCVPKGGFHLFWCPASDKRLLVVF